MSFSGIGISMRGVYASRAALNITNENIVNTSTDGYVRRIATFSSVAVNGTRGVTVSATRMRDSYLDTKVVNENSVASEWSSKTQFYEEIMEIIDEPSDTSLNTTINEFFDAFQELSKNPTNITNRTVVLQKAEQFTDYLNNMAGRLEAYQEDLNSKVQVQVAAINSLTKEIADLNKQIYTTEITGGDASYQHDQLELKIRELSNYGNVEVTEHVYGKLVNGSEDKRTTIMFGGTVIVDHVQARELVCTKKETKTNPEDVDGLYNVTTKEGTALDLSSGSLKAIIELRDGTGDNGNWVKGVPYYLRELNKFASTFAKAFNEGIIDYNADGNITADEQTLGYKDGYVVSSEEGDDKPGFRFFTIDGISTDEFINGETDTNNINAIYNGVTAKNISLSADIIDNIDNLFLSFTDPSNKNDTDSILSLLGFREDTKIFGTGDVDDFIEGLVTEIGLDANMAEDLNESHQALLVELENRRASYSDVSIDEELTNLIRYQQLYNASAKSISVYQQLYDTLMAAI